MDRRGQAQSLVAALYREADGLSDTSNDIEESARRLAGDLGTAEQACNLTQSALSRMTDRVVALTGAVAKTTAEADGVTAASIALSELAFASQRKVAAMDDRAAAMQSDIAQIERLSARVGGLAGAAHMSASRLGNAGAPVVTLALELRELGAAALGTIAGLETNLAEMLRQATAVHDLCPGDWRARPSPP